MNKIKTLLEELKVSNQSEFESVYEIFMQLMEDCDDDIYSQLEQFNIDALVNGIHELEGDIEEVLGLNVSINGQNKKLFPLAEYGWDGGYSIKTITHNLDTLSDSSIASGPFASIVSLKNPASFGLALHIGQDFTIIQIFQ
jgi:archaellum component FlaF (FlaF/FlaG flagellin family)